MQILNNAETVNKSIFSRAELIPYTIHCILGSLFLAFMAQFSVDLPFNPVPITLQTLGLYLLVISQGTSKATGSVILYLVQATCGLPVLAGGFICPLWVILPSGGYLIGFIPFTLIAGKLLELKKSPTVLWTACCLSIGQLAIWFIGSMQLAFFQGFINAFYLGVVPFILGFLVELACACSASIPINFFFLQRKK